MNKYLIKIVPFDIEKHNLQDYPNIEKHNLNVGYLVYQDDKLIRRAWFKSHRSLFKSIDKFLNNDE